MVKTALIISAHSPDFVWRCGAIGAVTYAPVLRTARKLFDGHIFA